jgi:hypothetical protein
MHVLKIKESSQKGTLLFFFFVFVEYCDSDYLLYLNIFIFLIVLVSLSIIFVIIFHHYSFFFLIYYFFCHFCFLFFLFGRWLSERYPMVNQTLTGASFVAEIDNLYLDMNGIIHTCSHPSEEVEVKSETQMMVDVLHYIDKLLHLIKPKKLFYLAIDGKKLFSAKFNFILENWIKKKKKKKKTNEQELLQEQN